MTEGETLVVYADFNCPFCYLLNEHLLALGIEKQVQWRSIEHEPEASFFQVDGRVVQNLEDEVLRVRQRAPQLLISLPSARANTRLATHLIIAANRQDSARAILLRGLIYRAYWIEGRDISNPEILLELALLCGFTALADSIDDQVHSIAEQWFTAWDQGRFDRRIPSLQRLPSEQQFLGLPSLQQLQQFYELGQVSTDQESPLVCIPEPRQTLLVADADADADYCRAIETTFSDRYDVISVCSSAQVVAACVQSTRPDLVLMNVELNPGCGFEACRELKSNEHTQPIAVLLFTEHYREDAEIKGLEYGASDFLCKSVSTVILGARVKTHLQLARLTATLETRANFDSLTGLYNRREFEHILEVEWRRACRNSTPLSIMFMDIDYFKHYNDSYGHLAGDDCLRKVGSALKASLCRSGEFVARYGGEEFVAILPNSEGSKVQECAERILTQVERLHIPHRSSEVKQEVTLSIGIATEVPALGESPQELLGLADKHLYQAKSEGRNRMAY
ncbi:MAG: diguanylate cyclase domain-containing protein [Cellvibrionaceae bacterium]